MKGDGPVEIGGKVSNKRTGHATTRAPAVPVDLLLASAEREQRTGDFAAAAQLYRRVLETQPHEERATQLLGAILAERAEIDAAIDLFESAVPHVGPASAETLGFYNNYANTLRRAGRLNAAEEILRDLVAAAPRAWQPWHNLGQTLRDQERFDEAAAAMRRAVQLEPDFGPNHGVLGEILHHLGRLNSADVSLRRAIELGCANDHSVWTLLGNNQRMLGHLEEALEMVTRAMVLCGGTPASHSNVGVVMMQLGRNDESVAHLHQAIAGDPENNGFHGYLAYSLLTSGRIAEAIEPWERAIAGGPRGTERDVDVPRWTPADTGSRVLVYREQGVGDEIMLASMYPDLIGATREVVIECETRLVSLFTRSFPNAEVRTQSCDGRRRETMHDFDRAIPAGSLIGHFRRDLADFPDRPSHLVADPQRVAEWKDRLAEIGPPPYVGISWRSQIRTAERRLEYTRLDQWGAVLGVPGVTWVNLQYDDCNRELHDAENHFGVRIHRWDWLDLMNDFDEVAALVSALDLAIAPFNAVSMLSGALGVRTFAIGRRFTWGTLGTNRLPWLPAVAVALRAPDEAWDGPLALAAQHVADAVAHAASHV